MAVGPAGDLSQRNSVKRLVFLPGDSRPLVAFVGVSEDSKRAMFVVSHDVSAVRGDGKCFPRRSACNYLELKPGDKASLDYAPQHDRRFNLKLREIKLVPGREAPGDGAGKAGTGADPRSGRLSRARICKRSTPASLGLAGRGNAQLHNRRRVARARA